MANRSNQTRLINYFRHPMGQPPMRLPTYPGLDRTAVLSYQVPLTLTVPSTGALQIAFQPQTLLPLWATQTLSTQTWFVSYLASSTSGGTSVARVAVTMERISMSCVGNGAGTAYRPAISGATAPLVDVPILGQDSGALPFIYVPAGANARFGAAFGTAVQSTVDVVLETEQWLEPGDVTMTTSIPRSSTIPITVNVGAGTGWSAAYTFPYNSWIRPAVLNMPTGYPTVFVGILVSAGTTTLTPDTQWGSFAVAAPTNSYSGLMPVVLPRDFLQAPQPWQDARIVAGELSVVNVTPQLNRGGTILAARLTPDASSVFNWTEGTLAAANPREKAFYPADRHFMAHMPPNTDTPLFHDATYDTTGAGNTTGSGAAIPCLPLYDLKTMAPYAAMLLTAAKDSTFALTVEWHLEFKTQSSLFPIGHSDVTLADMHAAARTLASLHPFSCDDGRLLFKTPPLPRVKGPQRQKQAKQKKEESHPPPKPAPKSTPPAQPRGDKPRGKGGRGRPEAK